MTREEFDKLPANGKYSCPDCGSARTKPYSGCSCPSDIYGSTLHINKYHHNCKNALELDLQDVLRRARKFGIRSQTEKELEKKLEDSNGEIVRYRDLYWGEQNKTFTLGCWLVPFILATIVLGIMTFVH